MGKTSSTVLSNRRCCLPSAIAQSMTSTPLITWHSHSITLIYIRLNNCSTLQLTSLAYQTESKEADAKRFDKIRLLSVNVIICNHLHKFITISMAICTDRVTLTISTHHR